MRATRLLIFLLAQGGCASAPEGWLLEDIRDVQVVRVGTGSEDFEAYSTSEGAVKGVAAGAAGGALEGVAVSVACGPYFVFCVPVGAAVGAVVGSMGGGVLGGLQGVSAEHVEALQAVTTKLVENRDLDEEFLAQVIASAKRAGGGTVNGENADAIIEVRLATYDLVQAPGDQISLFITATMALVSQEEGVTKRREPVDFVYQSPPAHVELWIENDGARFSDEFDRGFTALAVQIGYALWGPVLGPSGTATTDTAVALGATLSTAQNPDSEYVERKTLLEDERRKEELQAFGVALALSDFSPISGLTIATVVGYLPGIAVKPYQATNHRGEWAGVQENTG